MPEAQGAKTPRNRRPQAPRRRARLDFSTVGGIAIALAGILGGLLLEHGNIRDVSQVTAAMIVLGGTLGAVLVTSPMSVIARAFKRLWRVFVEPPDETEEKIEVLIGFATKARRNGIVSLEDEADEVEDPFLRKALNMAVDGTDLEELRKIMEVDIASTDRTAEEEARVWETAGGYAPTIGIIGAVMGLIQVMKHLDDIQAVGHGIAVAFVATVYGVGSANLFFLPAASKLRARAHAVTVLKELTLDGVACIVEGLNPALIRLKLDSHRGVTTFANPRRYGPSSSAHSGAGEAAAPSAVAAGN